MKKTITNSVRLNRTNVLSSEQYHGSKKLKSFNRNEWKWNSSKGLYFRVKEMTTRTGIKKTEVILKHTTNVFTILNEDKMEIVKQTIRLKENIRYEIPMIFETEWQAEKWAASNLECWNIINSNFEHKFIQHKQNVKPEVVKIERGGSIDIESDVLHVVIRFADKWDMEFDWRINNNTNWVHTNAEPTHFNNVEIDEESDLAAQNAKRIMLHFDFEEQEILIGEEIERREHHIS